MSFFQRELLNHHQPVLRDIVVISSLATVLIFYNLSHFPLTTPDGARYAEIAREMLELKKYLTPHLNYIPYLEKPPLVYWLSTASIAVWGVHEWAVRLWMAFFSMATILSTYYISQRYYGRLSAWLAVGILAFNVLFLSLSQRITLDMPVTAWICLTLFTFILALDQPQGKARRHRMWLAATFAACGVLTKGIIGFAIPAMVVGLWIMAENRWLLLKEMNLLSSLALFAALIAPWHLLAELHTPGFLHYYLFEHHLGRYFTSFAARYQPAWYYLPILIFGFWPWIAFLPQAVYIHIKHSQSLDRLLIIWLLSVFTLFSLSQSKLIPYILPCLPPAAILVGHYLAKHWQQQSNSVTWGIHTLLLSTLLLIVVLYNSPLIFRFANEYVVFNLLHQFAFTTIIGTGISTIFYYSNKPRASITALFITVLVFLLQLNQSYGQLDYRSLKHMVKPIAKANPDADWICYGDYFQDLPFYTQKRTKIVGWENELEFGAKTIPDGQQWLLTRKEFWSTWPPKKKTFIVMMKDKFDEIRRDKYHPIHFITHDNLHYIVSNQPSNAT